MSKDPTWLLQHKRDIHSQTGEDGIIEAILDLLPEKNNWCVEFGAWDGLFMTNTRYLIEEKGYSAVLIEGDPSKAKDLRKTHARKGHVYPVNQFVGFEKEDNLDQILASTPIPKDFDFLSMDIDGNEFHVWKAFSQYQPKAIVVEFNPTIPTHLEFVQLADPNVNQGASLLSLVKLGKEKGYELVSVLPFNAFFVRSEYFPLFEIAKNAPEVLRTDTGAVTYIFSGYDGRVFLHGGCQLPWHGLPLQESKMQPLPAVLRKFPGCYGAFEKVLFLCYLLFVDPRRFFNEVQSGIRFRMGWPKRENPHCNK